MNHNTYTDGGHTIHQFWTYEGDQKMGIEIEVDEEFEGSHIDVLDYMKSNLQPIDEGERFPRV